MSKKTKRTLVAIRVEKAALSDLLKTALYDLHAEAKKTPKEFIQTAHYTEILDFKDAVAKAQDYWVNGTGSAKVLIVKINKVTGMLDNLKKFTDFKSL